MSLLEILAEAPADRGQGLWEFFVQNVHPGTIRLDDDHAVYHDRYQRTPDGWKFAERVYEVRYLDSTPLAGSPPRSGLLPAE
ncbi:hypothetical protein ACIBG6_11800 [Streptomyces sp. NPDC050842]|uniref:hypothetical protein n=1 Tax=Streptomyces sp. NPDC050842 TaxID=3365636 RepID=UPI00379BFFE2